MKTRTRTNWMLLAMVLVLGAGAVAEIEREKELRPQPLTSIDITAVNRFSVSCKAGGCQTRRFENRAGRWWMREPYALPAEEVAVARLLAIARMPIHFRHPASELDATKLGLDPPQTTLNIGDTPILVGTTDAINGDRYVRVGDSIALVRDRFSPFLGAAPESELDRHVVPLGVRVRDVTIRDGEARSELAGIWERTIASGIAAPKGDATDSDTPIVVKLANGDAVRYSLRRAADGYTLRRAEPALDFSVDEKTAQALLGN